MDMRAFADGYRSPANHHFNQNFDNYDVDVDEQMEGSRKWASFFDEHLTRFLTHNRSGEDTELRSNLLSYRDDWAAQHGRTLYSDILNLSKTHPEALKSLNEFNFHALNTILVPMWYQMLRQQESVPMQRPIIEDMQLHLALSGTALQILRDKYLSQNPHQAGISHSIDGQLTEIDSAIALLEMTSIDAGKEGTHLVVVPAPPKFEAGYDNSSRACDFVVADLAYGQVRGVQSKSRLREFDIKKYDPNFISFIDGMFDLKNVVVTGPGTVDTGPTLAPRPGLISLDYLINRTSVKDIMRNKAFNENMQSVIQKHAYAKAHFGTRKSVINEAGYTLGNRLYEEMYSH